eukprot:GHRR01026380.1.p1 GENE.GHRR01026380.1~~GHRR01026380.1.p1  ORF type:complete len:562 (+),score=215.88 GHRR01026380.1:54-1739(+)
MLLQCPVFCQPRQVHVPSGSCIRGKTAACGYANTAIVTQAGRVLICGDASSGQCGPSWLKAGSAPELVAIGPDNSWHGLTRPTAAEAEAAGGDVQQALAKVVQVAIGHSTCYALTDAGEVFAWGSGSKGELGKGGCVKVQATPAKLPWATNITQLVASLEGHFAAAIDTAGRLYTWGAGKWGQLGHGNTSKRAVGRAVKQIKNLDVLQVACGSEALVVLTSHKTPQHPVCERIQHRQQQLSAAIDCCTSSSDQTSCSPTSNSSKKESKKSGQHWHMNNGSSSTTKASAANCSRISSRGCGNSSKQASKGHGKHSEVKVSTGHRSSLEDHAGCSSSKAASSTVSGMVDITDRNESSRMGNMESAEWVDVDGKGPYHCPRPHSDDESDADGADDCVSGASDPNASTSGTLTHIIHHHSWQHRRDGSRRDRQWGQQLEVCHRCGSSQHSKQQQRQQRGRRHHCNSLADGTECSNCLSTASSDTKLSPAGFMTSGADIHQQQLLHSPPARRHERHPRMDTGFKLLLKRLLKGFVSDATQRELTFPASLNAADRWVEGAATGCERC